MTKIEIKNVQSITHEEIEVNGFTVLTGVSNYGKSALLRGINAAIKNAPLGALLQKGKKECKVKISNNDFSFEWVKGKKGKYIVGDKIYENLGREVPKEITEKGFRSVKCGSTDLDVIYGSQFDPIFLLNKQGSDIANLITSVTKIDAINKASIDCARDLKKAKSDCKKEEQFLKTTKAKLGLFDPLGTLDIQIKELDSEQEAIEGDERTIQKLSDYSEKLEDYSEKLTHFKEVAIPKISDEEIVKIAQLGLWETNLNTLINKYKHFKEITVPEIESVNIDELEQLTVWGNKLEKLINRFDNFNTIDIPVCNETTVELERVTELYNSLLTPALKFKEISAEEAKLAVDISKMVTEKERLEKELKLCPLCSKKF